ncbi:hypothetical protein C1H46_030388 [Malus baccata]|uniref:Uncharacterized protein n=1 Tax=Malus baccata TaxID=106549 RepID=A0A540LC60_MALBA|nr:hypothetical protein C1H46_030388 [Malus baccata]
MDDNKVKSTKIHTTFEVTLPLKYFEDYHRGYIMGHPNRWDVCRKLAQIQKAKFPVHYELAREALELKVSEKAASGFNSNVIPE